MKCERLLTYFVKSVAKMDCRCLFSLKFNFHESKSPTITASPHFEGAFVRLCQGTCISAPPNTMKLGELHNSDMYTPLILSLFPRILDISWCGFEL